MPTDKSSNSDQTRYPLHEAIIKNNFTQFNAALADGYDINEKDELGETPLISATTERLEEWVRFILDHGADINGTDKHGDTALDWAEYQECKHLIKLLKERGATVRDGISYQQQVDDDYIEAQNEILNNFLDDRVFVFQLVGASPARWPGRSTSAPTSSNKRWLVIIRQNCPGYPARTCHEFESEDVAVAYIKKMAPATPRVSLGEMRPDPVPTWEEFQKWLVDEGLPPMPY